MKNPFVVLTTLLILSLAAAGCAAPSGTDSDVEGVQAWKDAMLAAQNASDAAAATALSTDDAVYLPPDGARITGSAEVQAWWEDFFSQGSLEVSVSDDEIQASGDWGFVRGTWNVTITPAEGGEPVGGPYYFIVVMHREDDGVWKLARVIWHVAKPATAEE